MKLNALKVYQENEYKKHEEERQKKIAEEQARYDAMSEEEKAKYDKKREEKRKELWRLLNFPAYVSEILHGKSYK